MLNSGQCCVVGLLFATGLVSGCRSISQRIPGSAKTAVSHPADAIPGIATPPPGETWTIAQAFKQYKRTHEVELAIDGTAVAWDGSGSGHFAVDPAGKVLAVMLDRPASAAIARAYPWRMMKARVSGEERWDILPPPGTRLENLKSQKIPSGWLRVFDSR